MGLDINRVPHAFNPHHIKLRLDLALLAAQHAGLPRASAYVVARLLTPAEVGWAADERVQWIQELERTQRLQLLERRIHAAWVREKLNEESTRPRRERDGGSQAP